ncbi:hypothetical protein ACFPRL_34930 [Pseudoclavibacter helvolus]
MRPPGSPHRYGDSSRPAGPLDALLDPSVTPDQMRELRAFLIDTGAEELARSRLSPRAWSSMLAATRTSLVRSAL